MLLHEAIWFSPLRIIGKISVCKNTEPPHSHPATWIVSRPFSARGIRRSSSPGILMRKSKMPPIYPLDYAMSLFLWPDIIFFDLFPSIYSLAVFRGMYQGGYYVKVDGDLTSVAPKAPPDTLPIGLLFSPENLLFATRSDSTAIVAEIRSPILKYACRIL